MTYQLSTLIESQGTWLRSFAWDWYFTGTFAKRVTIKGARFLLSEYIKSLEQLSGTAVNMYWSAERGPLGGSVHIHGLIGNVKTITAFCGCESHLGGCCCGVHLWH